jgi:hypothetical protein
VSSEFVNLLLLLQLDLSLALSVASDSFIAFCTCCYAKAPTLCCCNETEIPTQTHLHDHSSSLLLECQPGHQDATASSLLCCQQYCKTFSHSIHSMCTPSDAAATAATCRLDATCGVVQAEL